MPEIVNPPEVWLAVAGGSIGALGAMCLFRHKTRHLKFILGIPAILLLQALLVFWLAVVDSPSLLRSKYHFALKIEPFL